jgi:SAM-dependent methyltransferase
MNAPMQGMRGTEQWQGSVPLVCPDCRTSLIAEAARLRCPQCKQQWPVVDGVPHFVSEDQYWGEIDQEEMVRINQQIRHAPWRDVLRQHPSPQVRAASSMMMNPDRANWHLLLPLPRAATVLDIGAGSGAIAHAMANCYGRVIAIEPVVERIEFMRQRFRQEGLNNVTLVRGDVGRIPLPPGSVDLAILNGVLEWIPWSVTDGRPRDVQLAALRTIREMLRPGGFLCVGIENRWMIEYFIGANDPHADIPYVTILPRFLADAYARWRTGQPYRNYLYSAGGYRRLMEEAGFSDVEIYCAWPSYNHPRFIIPFDEKVFAYFCERFDSVSSSRKRRWARRLLRLLKIDKHLVYSFFIIGRHPEH